MSVHIHIFIVDSLRSLIGGLCGLRAGRRWASRPVTFTLVDPRVGPSFRGKEDDDQGHATRPLPPAETAAPARKPLKVSHALISSRGQMW